MATAQAARPSPEQIAEASLTKDFELFERLLPQLLRTDPGRYVLIRAEDKVGVFDTYEEALRVGYQRFQFDPFFVKEIAPQRAAVIFINGACPT